MANKSSLDNVLQSVLAVVNKQANQSYPPWVFSQQYNITTSFLINALIKRYPDSPEVIDVLDPFIQVAMIPCTNGFIKLPDGYRDLLGTPMIFANPNSNGECGGEIEPLTAQSFKTGILKGGCKLNSVTIVPQSEFADLTASAYRYPTYSKPIGYFSGQKQIRICPYDLKKVAVLYVRDELLYNYGYITQPDDTYIFDPATSTESEWGGNAFPYLFKGVLALYGAYSSDPTISSFSQILNSAGIL